jgi:5-methylcytosine-specific restriction enzyme subunit McrC
MKIVQTSEWSSILLEPDTSLSEQDRKLATELKQNGKITVDELRSGIRISVQSWVGVVQFTDFELQVIPKLTGDYLGLVKLIDYVSDLDALRRFSPEWFLQAEGCNLLDIVAMLFIRECEKVVRQGLMADYIDIKEALPVLRGRFLVERQMLKRFGRLDVLECRHDERLTDIPENMILLAALTRCQQAVQHKETHQKVRRLLSIFQQSCTLNTHTISRKQIDIIYNRLNEHYREAHTLAWLILESTGIENIYHMGSHQCFSFLLDMNSLFEQFVRYWIQDIIRDTEFKLDAKQKYRSVIVDAATQNTSSPIIPDLVIQHRELPGLYLPIDVKYKLYDEKSLNIGDIYQTFLYAYSIGARVHGSVPSALILYPISEKTSETKRLFIKRRDNKIGAKLVAKGISIPQAIKEAQQNYIGAVGLGILDLIREELHSKVSYQLEQ